METAYTHPDEFSRLNHGSFGPSLVQPKTSVFEYLTKHLSAKHDPHLAGVEIPEPLTDEELRRLFYLEAVLPYYEQQIQDLKKARKRLSDELDDEDEFKR